MLFQVPRWRCDHAVPTDGRRSGVDRDGGYGRRNVPLCVLPELRAAELVAELVVSGTCFVQAGILVLLALLGTS